jgi:hypothetical protein
MSNRAAAISNLCLDLRGEAEALVKIIRSRLVCEALVDARAGVMAASWRAESELRNTQPATRRVSGGLRAVGLASSERRRQHLPTLLGHHAAQHFTVALGVVAHGSTMNSVVGPLTGDANEDRRAQGEALIFLTPQYSYR